MVNVMPDNDLIRQLETAAAEAMPALYTRFYDGWLLRFAAGYTRRANSIHPVYYSSLDCDEKIDYCESLYQRQNLPVIFKLTDACQPADLETRLIERGYAAGPAAIIQTASLEQASNDVPASGSVRMNDTWLNAYIHMNEVAEVHQVTLRGMLKNILTQTWYALVKDERNQPIAAGLGVLNGTLLGIFDVVVAPEKRNQGIGTRLMHDLMAWGKTHGAQTAYLQVNAANPAGLRLYERLGFRDVYRYWYRIKSNEQ